MEGGVLVLEVNWEPNYSFSNKMGTFVGSENILAGPQNFKGLFES